MLAPATTHPIISAVSPALLALAAVAATHLLAAVANILRLEKLHARPRKRVRLRHPEENSCILAPTAPSHSATLRTNAKFAQLANLAPMAPTQSQAALVKRSRVWVVLTARHKMLAMRALALLVSTVRPAVATKSSSAIPVSNAQVARTVIQLRRLPQVALLEPPQLLAKCIVRTSRTVLSHLMALP